MKSAIIVAVLFISNAIFAHAGSPTKIHCSLSALEYKEDITKLMDINELLQGSTYLRIAGQDFDCGQVCEGEIEEQGLYMRYHFNSQNGALELEDLGSGQSHYMSWTNEHDVTKSGYLLGSSWLTNRKGGLKGSARIFQIEASCWAISW